MTKIPAWLYPDRRSAVFEAIAVRQMVDVVGFTHTVDVAVDKYRPIPMAVVTSLDGFLDCVRLDRLRLRK